MNVFKNKAGGRGFRGHSISFFQDVSTFAQKLPDKLPRPIEELQIILMRESKVTGKKREFEANGSNIREALVWLIKNCPDYKEIQIDEDSLAQYPSEGGSINIQIIDEEVEKLKKVERKKTKTAKKNQNKRLKTTPKKVHLKMMMKKCSWFMKNMKKN